MEARSGGKRLLLDLGLPLDAEKISSEYLSAIIEKLVTNKERYSNLLATMEKQFNQLDELELLNFNRCNNGTKVKLKADDKPEVILILATHTPRSSKLTTIIHSPEMDVYGLSLIFDLKFYVSAFAGYGSHSDCMLALDQFRDQLKHKGAA